MSESEITIADCLRTASARLRHGWNCCDCAQEEQAQKDLDIARKWLLMAQKRIEKDTGAPFQGE